MFGTGVIAQTAFEPTSNEGIYELLDELASEKLIEVNNVVKPWSRAYIADKLKESLEHADQLSERQKKEIEFYLKDYRIELSFNTRGISPLNLFPGKDQYATSLDPLQSLYRDSLFAFSLRPAAGMAMLTGNGETALSTRLGLGGFAYLTSHMAVYGGYTYNYESTTLTNPGFLVPEPGDDAYTFADGSQDFEDYRWGAVYSNRWIALGLVHDRPQWGNGCYGTNILSGHAPAFSQIMLKITPVRWFELNYIHGWLGSGVVDSSRSYWDGDEYQAVYRPKYIAANMFSFMPVRGLNVSLGSSTIYSDIGVQAAYLVPFIFFRSADYELSSMSDNASANSQFFFNISTRNVKHLYLYFSLFVDEFSMYRVGKPQEHNFLSYKGGFRLSNWPVENVSFTAEYTRTLPAVYQHYISTSTFESDHYVLGHYMRDNAQELWLSVEYRPVPRLFIALQYNFGQKGNDAAYDRSSPPDEIPMLKDVSWQKNIIALRGRYDILTNANVFASISYNNVQGFDVDGLPAGYYLDKFTPVPYQGEGFTARIGAQIGF